jgi:hypothetical protein
MPKVTITLKDELFQEVAGYASEEQGFTPVIVLAHLKVVRSFTYPLTWRHS